MEKNWQGKQGKRKHNEIDWYVKKNEAVKDNENSRVETRESGKRKKGKQMKVGNRIRGSRQRGVCVSSCLVMRGNEPPGQ